MMTLTYEEARKVSGGNGHSNWEEAAYLKQDRLQSGAGWLAVYLVG